MKWVVWLKTNDEVFSIKPSKDKILSAGPSCHWIRSSNRNPRLDSRMMFRNLGTLRNWGLSLSNAMPEIFPPRPTPAKPPNYHNHVRMIYKLLSKSPFNLLCHVTYLVNETFLLHHKESFYNNLWQNQSSIRSFFFCLIFHVHLHWSVIQAIKP